MLLFSHVSSSSFHARLSVPECPKVKSMLGGGSRGTYICFCSVIVGRWFVVGQENLRHWKNFITLSYFICLVGWFDISFISSADLLFLIVFCIISCHAWNCCLRFDVRVISWNLCDRWKGRVYQYTSHKSLLYKFFASALGRYITVLSLGVLDLKWPYLCHRYESC